MTTEEAIDILGQLRKLGITRIAFAGGEPLTRADIPRIIKAASNFGFKRICVVSNGLLLNETKAKCLLQSGLTDIDISIDGWSEVHDIIRGAKGAFDKAITALTMITRLRDEGYHCQINVLTTLLEKNLNEITKVVNVCRNLNAGFFLNLLDTSPYFFSGIDISNLQVKSFKKLNSLVSELHRIKKRCPMLVPQLHISLEYAKDYYKHPKLLRDQRTPCYLGYLNVYIGAHGEVYSGCWALSSLGNLRTKRLEEILSSKDYKNRLQDMLLRNCPGCTCNYDMNFAYDLRSLFKEFIYMV